MNRVLRLPEVLSGHFSGRDMYMELSEQITPEDLTREYLNFMRSANSTCQIVTGDLLPKVNKRDQVAEILAELLRPESTQTENGGSPPSESRRVEMIIRLASQEDSDLEDIETFKKNLEESNPSLVDLAKRYPESFSLYISKDILDQHFAIADGKHVFLQQPKHPLTGPTYVYEVNDDRRSADYWQRQFDDLKSGETVRLTF